jgi:hypothetical protein
VVQVVQAEAQMGLQVVQGNHILMAAEVAQEATIMQQLVSLGQLMGHSGQEEQGPHNLMGQLLVVRAVA